MKNKDITPYNEQGQPHGYWESYYDDGQLEYKGNYVNDKRHGYWEDYWSNGQLRDKRYYI
jgi:uncharacterized protein